MPLIHPVILSGGVGSRLWPLSRAEFPKQLLALTGERSLIQETLLRTQGSRFARPSIICNVEHRFLIAEQARAMGVLPDSILLEPCGRNTAPAAAVAALKISETDPQAIVLLMPADHLIQDQTAFREALERAVAAAVEGYLVTFGITPRVAETGYGYIQRGRRLDRADAFAVARFVEKPDAPTAKAYLASKDYYWNSGIFLFRADVFLEELRQREPDIAARCQHALSNGTQEFDFRRLDADHFCGCKSVSIDYAVMEHTRKAAVVPADMGWSDIGSWEALWEVSAKDDRGNIAQGDVLLLNSRDSYLRSEGPTIAAIGLDGMIVVATYEAVLVAPRSAAQEVKKIVDRLKEQGRLPHMTGKA